MYSYKDDYFYIPSLPCLAVYSSTVKVTIFSYTMAKVRLITIGATASIVLSPTIFAGAVENRQAGCAHDNLLRALLNPTRTVEATSFCNDYLCRPSSTVSTFSPPVRRPILALGLILLLTGYRNNSK